MTAPMPPTFNAPPGAFMLTTHGSVQGDTVQSLWDLRSFAEGQGLRNVHWGMVNGTLVDKARCDSVRLMLSNTANQWLCFLDADMTTQPDFLVRMLATAYMTHPWADVVGAYCNLRGDMAIPTIDSGTGTWESHAPGSGVIEVMRTGAAALLIKRHVFERLRDPWFATRVPMRHIDALAEIDNLARMKFDGRNPLRGLPGKPWEMMEEIAGNDPGLASFVPVEVGEDSGFCDKVRNAGMRIVVDTGIVTGHVDRRITNYETHKEAVRKQKQMIRHCVGLL